MSERTRITLLIGIMTLVALVVGGVSIPLPYRAALQEEEARLRVSAQSQARLLEAVARFDAEHSQEYPGGALEATLSQMRDAHERYAGFGETGEFTLARREGDLIVFLLSHRYLDMDLPQPIPFDTELAEPQRRALSGESGTMIGPDYRGATVLAAYEPVAELGWGIVAKIDLAEVRAPFVRAMIIATLAALAVISLASALFVRVINPVLRSLEESEARWRSLVESSPDHIMLLDRDANIMFTNRTVPDLTKEEVIGRSVYDFTLPEFRGAAAGSIERALETGKPGAYSMGYHAADGEPQHFDVRLGPVFDSGQAVGLVSSSTNITDWVQAESQRDAALEELKEYSQRLEEMVEERARDLRDAQEQLVRREKLAVLGQMAGGVGHELRNPLGVISNAAFYLKMVHSDADETTTEYLDMISAEVQRAERIISSLLDFGRTRPAEREQIAVSALVCQVLERRPPPEGVRVTTQIADDLPPAYVDPQQIDMVLSNLITNAYQAMPDGGNLIINAAGSGRPEVSISITDTGCGISAENMKKLFEPLFTTKARGIGLGLAVSRNLVKANGGTIEVESTEGEGSTFTVTLATRERELAVGSRK